MTNYSASSSDTTKATVSITGSTMTITGVAVPGATITVTAANTAGSATQTYSVTVTASTTTTPTAGGPTIPTGGPSVNAGGDQTVSTGAAVSLGGSGSPVNDDDASYSWTQQSGTTVSLTSSYLTGVPYTAGLAGSSARFTAPSTAGTLIFRLTVRDAGTGISSWDEVAITVQL